MSLTNRQLQQLRMNPEDAAQLVEIFKAKHAEETAYSLLAYATLVALAFGALGGGLLGFFGAVLLSVAAYYATFMFFLGATRANKPMGMLITAVGWLAPVVLLIKLVG